MRKGSKIMAAWNEILDEIQKLNPQAMAQYLDELMIDSLKRISKIRNDRNVIFYASAFLQKPQIDPTMIQITNEEINAFMSVLYGMDFSKGLSLVLHTPGGITTAAETIVEYLHKKFNYIETIVPTFAMSAGTMLALSTDMIIMGRQSQLGPIDTQIPVGGRFVSARSIIDQFLKAQSDIKADVKNAHLWAPILGGMTPGLLIEAEKANEYSEKIVDSWLARKGYTSSTTIAQYFNSPPLHKSHGKRIDRDACKAQGLKIYELENDQVFQDAVLTAYHAMTILFEQTPASKIVVNNYGRRWIKNIAQPIRMA